jgi:hypothetical protein
MNDVAASDPPTLHKALLVTEQATREVADSYLRYAQCNKCPVDYVSDKGTGIAQVV